MKRILLAAASIAAFAVAGTAAAQSDSQNVAITANVAPKCGVSAQQTTVNLTNDLTDADARVRTAVTSEIATALNSAQIVAFCNGVNNSVTVERSVLARAGSTGNSITQGGFAQFIRYNLDATINGMLLDSTGTDGSSLVAQRFGGHISLGDSNTHVRFAQSGTAGAPQAVTGGSSAIANDWNAVTDRRIAAGSYTGSINVIVAPGA